MWQVRQCRCLSHSQKVLCFVCAAWGWSALSSMTTRRSLTDWDVMGLILEYSDVRSSERHSCSAWHWHRWHYWHKLCTVAWQYKHVDLLLIVVHKFTGGPSGLWQTEASHINKTLPHRVVSCSSVLKLYGCWWKREIVTITSTWTLDERHSPLLGITV